MKSLFLLRHAKTERDSPSGRDFDRQLTNRGRGDAARLGKELRKESFKADLILSSPAARAAETVQEAGLTARYEPRIYNASTGELLDIVKQVDGAVHRLMLVGHNPGFENMVAQLTAAHIGVPTGTLVEIELPIERWADVGENRGRIVRSIRGRELD